MFLGHFAVGFASKKLTPETNLGWLIAAPIFLDLIWPVFLLLNLEQVKIEPGNTALTPFNFVSYPISHSLVGALGWSVLFALLYFSFSKQWQSAIVIGAGVLSHWVLDAIVHRPDLPLYPGDPDMVGLGLWNSIPGTLLVEGLLFLAGTGIYWRITHANDRIGSIGFWSFTIFLLLVYIANVVGPPPESVNALAGFALIMWIFPFWAAFFDSHRRVKRI